MEESSEYTKGLVSVIIPTYNRADIIEPSIRSVLEQTYDNLEIIISDDRSTDNTKELIDKLAADDPRIHYILSTDKKGAAGARNSGIRVSHGEFIEFQDSDDRFTADKTQLQVDSLRSHKNCQLCYARFQKDLPGDRYYIFPNPATKAEDLSGDIYAKILYDNLIGCPTLMVRHDYLDRIGYFDTGMAANEDYDLAIRLTKDSPAAFVDKVLLMSSTTQESLSLDISRNMGSLCYLVMKYKKDLMATDSLNHRLEQLLTDAQKYGILNEIEPILEKIMTL